MVDVSRDPRGRVSEGSGEDALGSQIAKAMVRYQQDDLSKQFDFILRETFCFVRCLRSGS
jgi:hypothetical protein